MNRSVLLLITMSVLSMGYYLYVPTPPDHINPGRGRFMTLYLDALDNAAYVVASITGGQQMRYVSEWTDKVRKSVYPDFPELEVEDRRIAGVDVRMYRRKEVKGSIPAVIYIHGGGWVIGNVDSYDGVNVRLALMTNMTIISVEYRKAPAHPYPIPLEDCLQVTQHVMKHGKELGVDSKQVFLVGDSAGGNLVASVSLKLSSDDPSVTQHNHPIKAQVLLSPVMQAITFNNPSYLQSPPIIISRERMVMFWTAYMGIPSTKTTISAMLNDRHVSKDLQKSVYGSYAKVKGQGEDQGQGQSAAGVKDDDDDDDDDISELVRKMDSLVVDPFLAPLMADDRLLQRSPPTFVLTCDYDQLRDEGVAFAQRLKKVKVSTEFKLIKGQTHPVLPALNFPSSIMALQDYEDMIRDAAAYIVNKAKH